MDKLKELALAVEKGNAPGAKELTDALLAEGMSAKDVLNKGLLPGMEVVGIKFKNNEIYIPEVLIAARAMSTAMEVLRPILTETGVEPVGKIIIGTVKGDLHDIGKNLVKMMSQGAGIEVIDLGTDCSPDKFLNAYKEHQEVKIIGMSALLTTTMTNMKGVIDKFESEGLRDKIKIMIGGAPVTEQFANEIGADGYSPDAASAAQDFKEVFLAN